MYAKIFRQIFESSIAENPDVRVTFMDLLILADRHGVVDMTPEAIHRITNRPLETIRESIKVLEQPDKRSRTPDDNGARLRRIDKHRDWGWIIVNYSKFREIHNETERREKMLERVKKVRENTANPQAEMLYKLYPRHVARGAALQAIAKALASTPFETLRAGVVRYAKERQGEDQNYTPHPATWFNQCRWLDDPAPPKSPKSGEPRKLAPGEMNQYGEIEELTTEQIKRKLAEQFGTKENPK